MKKTLSFLFVLTMIVIFVSCGGGNSNSSNTNQQKMQKKQLKEAENLVDNYRFSEAITILDGMDTTSEEVIKLRNYSEARIIIGDRYDKNIYEYNKALELFTTLNDYRDSKENADKIKAELKTAKNLFKLPTGNVVAITGNQTDRFKNVNIFDEYGDILIHGISIDTDGYKRRYKLLEFGEYLLFGSLVWDKNYKFIRYFDNDAIIHSNLLRNGSLFYDSSFNKVDLKGSSKDGYLFQDRYELQLPGEYSNTGKNLDKFFSDDGYAIVKDKETGSYGILRPDNTVAMIEGYYTTIEGPVKNGFLKVSKYNKYGFVDSDGNLIGDGCVWDKVDNFVNGYCKVTLNNKVGIIDETGKLIGPGCVWDDCSYFQEGLCAVKVNGKWGFIDTVGQLVIPAGYARIVSSFEDGTAVVQLGNASYDYDQAVLIDRTGKILIDKCYSIVQKYNERGYALISKHFKGYSTLPQPFVIDRKGNIIANTVGRQYYRTSNPSSYIYDNYLVSNDGNVVDLDTGTVLFNCNMFSEARIKKMGDSYYLLIQTGSLYGLMSLDGKIILDCEYSEFETLEDCDIAIVIAKKKSNSKCYAFDSAGKKVFNEDYTDIEYSNGLFYLLKDETLTIMDTNMKQIL